MQKEKKKERKEERKKEGKKERKKCHYYLGPPVIDLVQYVS
jgi:hypothetical protein